VACSQSIPWIPGQWNSGRGGFERDASSDRCSNRIGVGDGARRGHGGWDRGGAHGMRGDKVGVGDIDEVQGDLIIKNKLYAQTALSLSQSLPWAVSLSAALKPSLWQRHRRAKKPSICERCCRVSISDKSAPQKYGKTMPLCSPAPSVQLIRIGRDAQQERDGQHFAFRRRQVQGTSVFVVTHVQRSSK